MSDAQGTSVNALPTQPAQGSTCNVQPAQEPVALDGELWTTGPCMEVEGQIIHRRSLSKKLVFMDIKRMQPHGDPPLACPYMEMAIKVGVFGDVAAIQGVRDTLGLGDMVHVTGSLDPHGTLLVRSITCTSRWSKQPLGSVGGPQFQPDHASISWWAQGAEARRKAANRAAAAQPHAQQQGPPHGQAQQKETHTPVQPVTQACMPAQAHAEQWAHVTGAKPTATAHLSGPQAGQQSVSQTQANGDAMVEGRQGASGMQSPAGHHQEAVHAAAAGSAPKSRAVCKWWLNSRRCAHGERCPFLHSVGDERREQHKTWLQDRKAARQMTSAQAGFVVHAPGERASTRRLRAAVFARWLVDTWGVRALSAGAGVLDVAGGRGALSWELQVVHGVRVTLVEPRDFKLDRQQHKALKTIAKQAARETIRPEAHQADDATELVPDTEEDTERCTAAEEAEDNGHDRPDGTAEGGVAGAGSGAGPAPVKRVRLAAGLEITQIHAWFDERLWGPAVSYAQEQGKPGLPTTPASAASPATNVQTNSYCNSGDDGDGGVGCTPPATMNNGDGGTAGSNVSGAITWPAHVLDLVADCSVVVGLHPDQATEEIIRFVHAFKGKPFAIVPCCVFPRLYPHRRLRSAPAANPGEAPAGSQGVGETPGNGRGASHDSGVMATSCIQTGKATHGSAEHDSLTAGLDTMAGTHEQVHGDQMHVDAGTIADAGSWHSGVGAQASEGDVGMWSEPSELMRGAAAVAAGTSGGAALSEGLPVTQYSELVRYLVQEGGQGTREGNLLFEGANRVVWRK